MKNENDEKLKGASLQGLTGGVRSSSAVHTPGSWIADKFGCVYPERGTKQIAVVAGELTPERDANARLIAAAPDLLKAARAKLANCEGCMDAALLPGEYCSDECIALVDAIAKAEGR